MHTHDWLKARLMALTCHMHMAQMPNVYKHGMTLWRLQGLCGEDGKIVSHVRMKFQHEQWARANHHPTQCKITPIFTRYSCKSPSLTATCKYLCGICKLKMLEASYYQEHLMELFCKISILSNRSWIYINVVFISKLSQYVSTKMFLFS